MRRKKKNGVEWLEFEILADIPGLKHGVFLRHGGVSEGAYASLNTGFSINDDPARVKQNLELVRSIMEVPRLVSGFQKHGIGVALVTAEKPEEPGECDGLITKDCDVGLLIKHADCQAAIFYDPKQRVIGNIHSGWRGNVQNIYASAVAAMHREFGSRPQDLLVAISPSLGPDKAEFKNYRTELPESFWGFQIRPTYFDLWAISRKQLIDAGVSPGNIEIASICTYTESKDFFSYRRDKPSGRHSTVVALTENF